MQIIDDAAPPQSAAWPRPLLPHGGSRGSSSPVRPRLARMLSGIGAARPARTGLPGGDAAGLSRMAAAAEERPRRVDRGLDCGGTLHSWIRR